MLSLRVQGRHDEDDGQDLPFTPCLGLQTPTPCVAPVLLLLGNKNGFCYLFIFLLKYNRFKILC